MQHSHCCSAQVAKKGGWLHGRAMLTNPSLALNADLHAPMDTAHVTQWAKRLCSKFRRGEVPVPLDISGAAQYAGCITLW